MSLTILAAPGSGLGGLLDALAAAGCPVADPPARAELRALIHRALGTCEDRWFLMPESSLDPASSRLRIDNFPSQARRWAADREGPWITGDPRMCLLADSWVEGFTEIPKMAARDLPPPPDYLLLIRDPAHAADALARRLGIPHAAAAGLWEVQTRALLAKLPPLTPVLEAAALRTPRGRQALIRALASADVDGPSRDELDAALRQYADDLGADPGARAADWLSPVQIALADELAYAAETGAPPPPASTPSFGARSALASLVENHRRLEGCARSAAASRSRAYLLERGLFKAARVQQANARRLRDLLSQAEEQSDRLLGSSRWKLANFLSFNFSGARSYPPLAKVFAKFHDWTKGQDELPEHSDLEKSSEARVDALIAPDYPFVDVVVPIHNALEDVRRCLGSLRENSGPLLRQIILVDDGSGRETAAFLDHFVRSSSIPVKLLTNPEALGYTRASNLGLAESHADLIVLLNSDTIVPPGWIGRILAAARSGDEVGIVGALSNAASWQSIPERFSPEGDWMVNDLPEGMDVDTFAWLHALHHETTHPQVPLVNGFCLAITRPVIKAIGAARRGSLPQRIRRGKRLLLPRPRGRIRAGHRRRPFHLPREIEELLPRATQGTLQGRRENPRGALRQGARGGPGRSPGKTKDWKRPGPPPARLPPNPRPSAPSFS